MKKRIYLDNAATTPLSAKALAAMTPYFSEVFGNPSSLHSEGQLSAEALALARERIAKAIGANAGEIFFTSGGSEADNQAIVSAARAGARKGKKHIISSAIEHHAVLNTLENLEKEGYEVTLLPVGERGIVDVEDLKKALRPDTALVTIMFANNEIGTIQPVKTIAEICKAHGVLFHTDAVQAAGHVRLNVKNLGVDMLSLSAHKFNGPKGAGVLYAAKGVPISPIIFGGAQERGKRAGTENLPAIVGMAEALEESCEHIEENAAKIGKLRDKLINGILEIPHSVLNGDKTERLYGNANFCFEGIEGESLLLLLDDLGICASSGSACTSGSLDPSHVLIAIGRPHDVAHGSLRLTLSADITEEDVDRVVGAVVSSVKKLRDMSPVWRELVEGKRKFIIG